MGCGGSKNVITPTAGNSQVLESPSQKPISASSTKNSKLITVKSTDYSDGTVLTVDHRPSSCRELPTKLVGEREVTSATSKMSTRTCDSGLEADFYNRIISEESDPLTQERVLNDTLPNDVDLSINGRQISTSAKRNGRGRTTEQDIIGELKSQGILTKPITDQSGMAFDVMIAHDFGLLKKPPARLAKLKIRKSKKKPLTKEELEEKLLLAEERRKRKAAAKLEKLMIASREKHVDESSESQQQQQGAALRSDMDRVAENREAHLQALRVKQEQKKAHAEKVRQSRTLRLQEALEASKNIEDSMGGGGDSSATLDR